jgi:predicted DNA-binding protein
MPEELLAELKHLADRKKVTSADVVRTACEKYLAAVKKAEAAALEAQRAAQ